MSPAIYALIAIAVAIGVAALLWQALSPRDDAQQSNPKTRPPEDDQGPDNDRGMW